MKIEMEFQGLKELMKAFEDAASDEDIKEVNQKIVKQSEPVVKNIMSGKIPKSADIKLSGRGFGSKSSVTSHAADSIPLGAVKVKDTGASADVGWEKSDNSEQQSGHHQRCIRRIKTNIRQENHCDARMV